MKNCRNLTFWSLVIFTFCWTLLATADDEAVLTSSSSHSGTENVNSTLSDTQEKYSDSGGVLTEPEASVGVYDNIKSNENVRERSSLGREEIFSQPQQFVEQATSQNSGVANEIASGGPPVVVTLTDVATELHQRATLPSSQIPPSSSSTSPQNPITNQTTAPVLNQTTEEIPSFSEWTQKRLEEAEKNKEPSNASSSPGGGAAGATPKPGKVRWKNYALLDCGAKVVASNPEAVSPSAILSPSRDEYKLNTCTSRIWFIVELCEAIQAKKIDLANFELFSSSPKDFSVFVSDRFPTRDWSNVGHFTAKDERDVQSFDLHPHLFGKYIKVGVVDVMLAAGGVIPYEKSKFTNFTGKITEKYVTPDFKTLIKVEVKSHYGAEHYCPISLFRVYGTSEFEVLQKEDPVHANRADEDDDDDDNVALDLDNGDDAKNVFSSATDAVISMVKKAAQALGPKSNDSSNNTHNQAKRSEPILVRTCASPSHLLVCDNCSDTLFGEIFELMSCRPRQVGNLVRIPAIRKALVHSAICNRFGFVKKVQGTDTPNSLYATVQSFFPLRWQGAMCNTLAILENRVLLNSSQQFFNQTQLPKNNNLEVVDQIVDKIETSEVVIEDLIHVIDPVTVTLSSVQPSLVSTVSVSDLASQIHPTRTSIADDSVGSNTSTVVDNVNASSDSSDSRSTNHTIDIIPELLDDSVENLVDLIGDEASSSVTQTTSATPQAAQKESVFQRLTNRIKALERNMSLSSQYLEELSTRYKKQVEEMQRLLDKTILRLDEENRRKDDRNRELEERVNVLIRQVELLLSERYSWSISIYCAIISGLVSLLVVNFCSSSKAERCDYESEENEGLEPARVKRRKSIDVVRPQVAMSNLSQKKKRRPSDQALKIVRSMESTLEHPKKPKNKLKDTTPNSKKSVERSFSVSTVEGELKSSSFKPSLTSSPVVSNGSSPVDWVERKLLEEIPFVLEESEHSTLEPVASIPPSASPSERISAPDFLKTATDSRSSRSSLINVNGDAFKSGGEVATPKKEKRGFKKIFKKVF